MKTRRETMLISKQSITAPFFLVKSKSAYFSRRVSPIFDGRNASFYVCSPYDRVRGE